MKITIARECGCYGDEVGQVLADRLNVPLYNKKTLTELAKKKGILGTGRKTMWYGCF